MDWLFMILAIFAAFLLQTEAKPSLIDADYTDDDLVAEESQSFAHASSSAHGGAVASASSSSFGGFGFGQGPQFYPYAPQHFPHQHYRQPAQYGPFYQQPGFEYPYYPAVPQPSPPRRRKPNFHGIPMPMLIMPHHHPMHPSKPIQNNKNKRPIQMQPPQRVTQPPRPIKMTTNPTRMPIQCEPTTRVQPMQPQEISTAKPLILPISSTESVETGSTSTTTDEPVYDIDIRINDN